MGKATIRGCRFSRIVRANTGYVEKKNTDGQSLPRVGKVASGASRIGFWRCEKERGNASQVDDIRKHPIHRCAVPLPQWGRQRNEDAAFLASSKRIHAYAEKKNTDGQSLPRVGKAKRRRLRRKKGSQPRLAALGSPFQGKGLAWTLPLSNGEGCETRTPLSPFCRIF